MNCIECKRPTRRTRESLDQFPGTVLAACRGLCSSCYNHYRLEGWELPPTTRKGWNEEPHAVPCQGHGCTRTLRPYGAKLEDWPGTYARKGKDLCTTCYEVRATTLNATPEGVAITARELDAYLAWRRPYRAKVLA